MDHDDNLLILVITVFELSYAFGLIFVVCELCHHMNAAFSECNNMVEQFEWYLWPNKLQRMHSLVIQFAQLPYTVHCFGSLPSDRETFKYVSAQ